MEETSNRHQRHHHHRSHPHLDDSEVFKRQALRANKRRKIFAKVLFVVLTVLAVMIVLFVAWIYTHN